MAHHFYITMEGTKSGKVKGNSVRETLKDKIEGVAWHYQVKSPRDLASGQASGKRQHGAVVFVTESGAQTPQLFQMVTTNEVIKSALFEFYHSTAEGKEEVYMTVKLTNATVSEFNTFSQLNDPLDHSTVNSETDWPQLDQISLTFQKIEFENKIGKTAGADDWRA